MRSLFQARDGVCQMGSLTPIGGITGYTRLPPNDYSSLMHAVATFGPIAISVDASWSFYEEVILGAPTCGYAEDRRFSLLIIVGTCRGSALLTACHRWDVSPVIMWDPLLGGIHQP